MILFGPGDWSSMLQYSSMLCHMLVGLCSQAREAKLRKAGMAERGRLAAELRDMDIEVGWSA